MFHSNEFHESDEFHESTFQSKIHLRLFKRNARKTITLIEGLDQYSEIDLNKFLKYAKTKLSCNGNIKKDSGDEDTTSKILIQLQGDHRNEVSLILQHRYHVENRHIVIHGY